MKFTGITSSTNVDIVTPTSAVTLSCAWTLDATESSLAGKVQWYKDNDKYNSLVTKSGGDLSDTLILSNPQMTTAGAYHCAVTFGEYGTITSTAMNHVVFTSVSPANDANTVNSVFGQTQTLSCIFTSSAPITAVAWTFSSSASTSSSEDVGSYSSTSKMQTSTLTYTGLLTNDSPTCTATFTCPSTCGVNTIASTQTLSVFGVSSLSTNVGFASVDTAVSITCDYVTNSSPTPTVKWYHYGTQIMSGSSFSFADSTGQSILSFPSNKIQFSDNGVYKCLVDYGSSIGTHFKTVNQYVRYLEYNSTIYVAKGEHVVLTCIVHGDEPQATLWQKGSTSISNDATYTLVPGHYISMKRVDTLVLSAAPDDGSVFTCSAYYAAGSPTTETGTITVYSTG